MKLIRELHRGMRGPDVRAMKRALRKAGFGKGIVISPSFNKPAYLDLRSFQHSKNLHVDGVLGEDTFKALSPYVDRYGRLLFSRAPHESDSDKTFNKLLAAMHYMADHTPGYQLGGGHGIPVEDINPRERTDCSSSTAYVLEKADLLPGKMITPLSWDFVNWGMPGEGDYFTVEASPSHLGSRAHVWIRLHKTRYWRFDTSPQGDGAGAGPRLRMLPRFTSGFVARRAKGL